MAGDLLGIGSSALIAYQRALSTISHNVANANTDGYTRQQVELSSRLPQRFGGGYLGTGVDVGTVRRIYDQHLIDQARVHTASYSELEIFHELSSGLDNLLTDDSASLSPALNSFFTAVQDVADNPTSIPARQVLMSNTETLASRFHELDSWMQGTRNTINTRLATTVSQINDLAGAIAAINRQIVDAQGNASGQPPNDLLDQRDNMVLELSKNISVSTVMQDNGSMNVFVGNGQVLVLGTNYNSLGLQAQAGDPSQLDITLNAGGSTPIPITSLVSGGELGGLLRFRDQVLNPAQSALGRAAIGLGTFVNEQHRKGVTLDGLLGQDLFNIASPQVLTDPANSGTITASFDDVTQLTTDDYELRFDGIAWGLNRVSNGQVVPLSGSGTVVDPFVAEGMSIVIGAGAAAGDNYVIRPTRTGAQGISMLLADPRELALAAPINTGATLSNTGTGVINAGQVTDIDNPAFQSPPGQLTPPILIRFTSATTYDVLDQGTLAVIDSGVYDPAIGEEIFPTETLSIDYGYRVRITGNPAAGDEFSVEFNTGGVGDNRNALLLAGLQTARLMRNGNASFNDAYGELVADIGTRTGQAEANAGAQQRILEQNQAARASVSGVNLDEEAADLIRFQQAFQAAAQIIAVADRLFDTLMGAVRR